MMGGRDFYFGPWKYAASRAEYDRLTAEFLVGGESIDGGAGMGDRIALIGATTVDLSIGSFTGIEALLGSDAGLYGAARLPMLGSDPAWE